MCLLFPNCFYFFIIKPIYSTLFDCLLFIRAICFFAFHVLVSDKTTPELLFFFFFFYVLDILSYSLRKNQKWAHYHLNRTETPLFITITYTPSHYADAVLTDGIQKTLPQNNSLWHNEHFKLRKTEKAADTGGFL
jgi:hypothetical protein